MQDKLLQHLLSFITPERAALFHEIVENRTNYIRVVLEDIFQPQNASAVLRTCDCFGIQNVDIIENRNPFQVDTEVALGASKWLTLTKHNTLPNNSLAALNSLKKQGYRIIATSPHANTRNLSDFDLTTGKFALVFGSELPGISEEVAREADEFIKIPMFGFTESFNISVSAAIILHHLSNKMRKMPGLHWQLNDQEKTALKIQWARNTMKKSELIEERFWMEQKKNTQN